MVGQGLRLSEGAGHQQTNQILENIVGSSNNAQEEVYWRKAYTAQEETKILFLAVLTAFNGVIYFVSDNTEKRYITNGLNGNLLE